MIYHDQIEFYKFINVNKIKKEIFQLLPRGFQYKVIHKLNSY